MISLVDNKNDTGTKIDKMIKDMTKNIKTLMHQNKEKMGVCITPEPLKKKHVKPRPRKLSIKPKK